MNALSRIAVVTLLSACGGWSAPAPAWPDPAERSDPEAKDGGESLEPRRASAVEGGGGDPSDEDASAVTSQDE